MMDFQLVRSNIAQGFYLFIYLKKTDKYDNSNFSTIANQVQLLQYEGKCLWLLFFFENAYLYMLFLLTNCENTHTSCHNL